MSGTGRTAPRFAPLLVVVTGPPAAGKTTLARSLSERTGLPLIEKDGIKELLFETLGTGDRRHSLALGRAAVPILYDIAARLLRAKTPLILEANFSARTAERELLALPAHRLLQIFLHAAPKVLLERAKERVETGERHLGHHQDYLTEAGVLEGLADGRWAQLDLPGRRIELDTSDGIDLAAVARTVSVELEHL